MDNEQVDLNSHADKLINDGHAEHDFITVKASGAKLFMSEVKAFSRYYTGKIVVCS